MVAIGVCKVDCLFSTVLLRAVSDGLDDFTIHAHGGYWLYIFNACSIQVTDLDDFTIHAHEKLFGVKRHIAVEDFVHHATIVIPHAA